MRKYGHIDLFFLALSLIFLVLFFIPTNSTLDLAVHDTYFVISRQHIALGIFLYCLAAGLCYFFLRKFQRKRVIWMMYSHFIAGIILPAIFVSWYRIKQFEPVNERYSYYSVYNDPETTNPWDTVAFWGTTVSILFLIAQGMFLLNLLIGILKKEKTVK